MLDKAEWSFTDLDKGEVQACFWWEYFREIGALPSSLCRLNDCAERIRIRGISGHFKWNLPDTLSSRHAWKKLPVGLRGKLAEGMPDGEGPVPVIDELAQFLTDEQMRLRLSEADFVNRVIWPPPFGNLHMKVDWSFNDKQIASAVLERLAALRPSSHPEPARKRQTSVGGFDPRFWPAALSWLGVLRRNSAGCRWRDFNSWYNENTGENDLQKKAGHAKHVMAWIQDGDRCHLQSLPSELTRRRRAKK